MKASSEAFLGSHFREVYVRGVIEASSKEELKKALTHAPEIILPSNIMEPSLQELADIFPSARRQHIVKSFAKQYRIFILGSARSTPGSSEYEHIEEVVAAAMEEIKCTIVSGAGPGIMQASNNAALNVRKDRRKNGKQCTSRSIGVGLDLPFENEKYSDLDEETVHQDFFTRISELVELSNGAYASEGGLGTILEMMSGLQLKQVGQIEPEFPLIVSPMYEPILDTMYDILYKKRKDMGATEFMSPDDISRNLIITDDISEIVSEFKKSYDWWYKNFRAPYKKLVEGVLDS